MTPLVPMKMEPWLGIFLPPSRAWMSFGGRSSPSYQMTSTVLSAVKGVLGKV